MMDEQFNGAREMVFIVVTASGTAEVLLLTTSRGIMSEMYVQIVSVGYL